MYVWWRSIQKLNCGKYLCMHKMFLHQQRKRISKTPEELFNLLVKGNRSALASAITLVESTRSDHIEEASRLLTWTLEYLKDKDNDKSYKPAFRIGLTGAPGAGKSSLIETFGKKLTAEGHNVAVLAIDPSSVRTGGSLLGDRTRMTQLAHDPNAYIRPSPNSGTLGGVTRKTNEAIVLCEGAGYDIVLVETVGIGQSELAVSDMVDMFVLVIPPAAGDELQGIKKGIVEMADLVLINKADGDLLPAAKRIQADYTSALKLLRRPGDAWTPRVYPVSALHNEGFEKVWLKMQQFQDLMIKNGTFDIKRKKQYKAWMWRYIEDNIMMNFLSNPNVKMNIKKYEDLVENEALSPAMAANNLLDVFSGKKY